MSKKQPNKRRKKLVQLTTLRQKRKLLENKQKLQLKEKRLDNRIRKEHQRIKKLKRETGASKWFNLEKLVKGAKETSKKLAKAKREWDKFKEKH